MPCMLLSTGDVKFVYCTATILYLQCFDTVGWFHGVGRSFGL